MIILILMLILIILVIVILIILVIATFIMILSSRFGFADGSLRAQSPERGHNGEHMHNYGRERSVIAQIRGMACDHSTGPTAHNHRQHI